MPLPTSIETLLEGSIVETARIEFKETWDPEASLKTICAFANDIDNWGGGYVVIGVRDNGASREIVGVPEDRVDRTLKDMLNKCKLISPAYMPIVDVAGHGGKLVVVAWCPGGSVRPYSSPRTMAKGEKNRVCYIRKMASTITPSEEELRDLYNLSNNVPFDDRVNHQAEVADLDPALVRNYLKEVGSDLYAQSDKMDFVDLCRRMNIVAGPPEYTRPLNVGLMFFNYEPEKFFPCAQIDVVEFPDGLGGDRFYEQTFTGPLHQQLRAALRYLRGAVVEECVVKRPDRAEADRFFNYPMDAIEEALSNAVYHKGYDVREPVEVRVTPQAIEVVSHPGADRSISAEGLRTYRAICRLYRNRRIGDFLKELHLTEGRNTGMAKILRAMRLNGSPDPVFETDEDRLYFITTLPVHPGYAVLKEQGTDAYLARSGAAEKPGLTAGAREDQQRPASPASSAPAASRTEAILSHLREHPTATVAQMCADLGYAYGTASRDVATLKAQGRLVREGSARSGSWVVR